MMLSMKGALGVGTARTTILGHLCGPSFCIFFVGPPTKLRFPTAQLWG